jgi:hypothetical protein
MRVRHLHLLAAFLFSSFLAGIPAHAQVFGTNTGTFVDWLPSYATDSVPFRYPGAFGAGYNAAAGGAVSGFVPTITGNVGLWSNAQNYASGAGYTIQFNAPNPAAINVTVGGMFNGLTNVSRSGNTYTATFTINHDNGNILAGGGEIDLAGASAVNPITNFHVVRPGGTLDGLTPQFQSYLNSYQAVRWMNNNNVNNNVMNVGVADLLPSGQNLGTAGNSYDDIIKWSNQQANLKTVWITIPTNANDAFVKTVADKFAQKLAPAKNVVVEYSNEPWNFAFTHPGQIYSKAQQDNRVTATDTYSMVGQEYGLQSAHIMQLFKQEFSNNGQDANRAQGFLNSQGANQWFVDQSKSAINRVFGNGSVANLFTYQGISFYPGDNLAGASSVDQLVSALYTDLNRQKTYLQNDINSASRDGLHEAIYEWGMNGYLTQGGVPANVWQAFRNDPRAKQWVLDEYAAIHSLLGNDPKSMAMEFTVEGDGWGPQINPMASPEQEQQGILALAALYNTGVPVVGGGTLIPEPATLAALGAFGLLLARRPRRQA